MADPRLVEYIQKGVKQGFNINYIKEVLIQNGHTKSSVDSAYQEVLSFKQPIEVEKHLEHAKVKRVSPTPFIIAIAVLCIILVVVGFFLFQSKQKEKLILESSKEVESSIEDIDDLVFTLAEKQQTIDEQIKDIETLNLTAEQREDRIQEQLEELKELNEETKKGFIKIRDLLLDLANTMLAR